ncbi:MAG: HEPN domain-containing protein [Candidatus Sumerlaeota bacterium]|nr:HEPN domain-containing protein [Candidatus Sumerlaeota bacterium]
MRSLEYAEKLLRKASQDEFAVNKLIADSESPIELIGFHAQQAVEKTLKAVLAYHAIRYRRIHDLVELIDLLRENNIVFPDELDDVRRLNPFAVEFRYDDIMDDLQEVFDREWIQSCVKRIKTWALTIIQPPSP